MTYKTIPLEHYSLPKGEIAYNRRFEEVQVAKEWGLTPFEFDRLPVQERATMIAFERSASTLRAVATEQAERDARLQGEARTRGLKRR